jgi:hypothetical protein
MLSIEDKIINKVKKYKRGTLFFIEDFISFGNAKSVGKALERLVHDNRLNRISRGIYARLVKDPTLGILQPTTEEIAEAIRRRDKARIIPSGNLALNALGLSSQIPLNIVYLTDGSNRTINIGKRKIIFKKTSPKNLATIGKISTLAIQALREIGNEKVTDEEIEKILAHLKNEDPYRLSHDIKLAPEWIREIMRKVI